MIMENGYLASLVVRVMVINMAELIAILHGLQLAWERGFRKIIVESDSLLAANKVLKDLQPHDPLFQIVKQCQELLRRDWECLLCHTYREANMCADFLASWAFQGSFGVTILTNPGGHLHRLIEDLIGVARPRAIVGLMLSGMGASVDVFGMARSRWEKRQMKVLEKAKIRMMKKKSSDKSESYWSNLWENSVKYKDTEEEEMQERSKRAAAAARRWREYSRKGADRRPTFNLPEALSKKD